MRNERKRGTGIAMMSLLLAWSVSHAAFGGVMVVAEQRSSDSPTEFSRYSLDIYVDLTGPDDGGYIDVGNFQVRVRLGGTDAGSGVLLSGLEETGSPAHPQSHPLGGTMSPDATEFLGYTINVSDPFRINDGDGLLRVILDVQPNVTGNYALEILTGDGNTMLTDSSDFMTPLPIGVQNGSLTLTASSTVVPEPRSATLFAVYGICSLAFGCRPPRRSSHPSPVAIK